MAMSTSAPNDNTNFVIDTPQFNTANLKVDT